MYSNKLESHLYQSIFADKAEAYPSRDFKGRLVAFIANAGLVQSDWEYQTLKIITVQNGHFTTFMDITQIKSLSIQFCCSMKWSNL